MTNVAADSSVIIAYLNGETGPDIELLNTAFIQRRVRLPAIVIVETLSNPRTRASIEPTISELKVLLVKKGFWYRASALRATILEKKLKASLADTLIAQSCIDHDIPLITRDRDFRHFAEHGGLKLAIAEH